MIGPIRSFWAILGVLALTSADRVHAALPLVDFNRMGSVGLAGAFAGIDLFDDASAFTFDPSTSTLLARAHDGSLSPLGATNQGGSIVAGCALGNTVFLAGTFSSVNGTAAANVISYSPSSSAFTALPTDGPNGPIHAVFCDSVNEKLWVGGSFTSPGSAVAIFDTKAKSWSAVPFGGLSGAASDVLSITTNSSAKSLFFAGSFTTSFVGNASSLNTTNNPNVPFSPGATPFSSSLVPIPLQNASTQGQGSSSDPSFSNIHNILCPSGPDGPGSTWLGADGITARITARAFTFINANGIRLGNTFLNGRSTTLFSVTTIPDNAVQTLQYIDPITKESHSCSNACPLSTDSSILYQDFTFSKTLSLTGIQVTLSGWTGSGPGLHILQLLSSGAFASAVPSQNAQSCFAPAPSNTSHTGNWTEVVANTDIAATTESILVSDVPVGTPSSQAPSVTWQPYVSASGQYDINLLVPGCTDFQDCASRTSVKVTVFPGGGQQPVITTVPQTNTADASQQIYSGPIVPSSPDFVTTITMTLADNPIGSGANGHYTLVADRVELVLTSANTTGATTAGVNGTSGGFSSFGFFEWPLSASNANAQSALPNSTETSADAIGISLFNGLGGSSGLSSSFIKTVAHHGSGAIVIGGSFSLSSPNSANIAVFKNGALSAVSGGGLNGNVTSFSLFGDKLFVGGSFNDTTSKSTNGALRGVAVYDVVQDTWSALQAGVDGMVTDLLVDSGALLVTGNFTTTLSSVGGNSGQNAHGFAVWNVSSGVWENSGGFLVGAMTFIGNNTSEGNGQLLAGSVSTSLKFGASGLVTIKNGAGGAPAVTALGVALDETTGVTVTSNVTKTRRSPIRKRVGPSAWSPHVKIRTLFNRQTSSSLPPLPSSLPAPAPAILTGAFWTNTSNSQEIIALGGNFTSGSASSIAFYNSFTGTLAPLNGAQPNGTILALLVQGARLFVGGEFTISSINANGFAVYDLIQGQWESGLQPLQPSSGNSVVVRSITSSNARPDTVSVAGSFAQAGSTACVAICSFDTNTKQWSGLGPGIQGDISAVDYAGNNQEVLIAAGSIGLVGSSPANILRFTFSNSSWSAVGDATSIPGPVTALAVNDLNGSSIFAAGRSADGSTSFLTFWNGATWANVGPQLGTSNISQLTVVPLQNTHVSNGVIEPDRVLMVSGMLQDTSFGAASTALFDGSSLMPYFTTSSAGGTSGSVSQLFRSLSSFSFSQRHLLATGIVILISIAISAGVIFLLVLVGILWTLFSRRDDVAAKFEPLDDSDTDSVRHRPSSLLAHINAATRTTILGAVDGGTGAGKESVDPAVIGVASTSDPFAGPDASNYLRAETPSDAFAGLMAGDEEPGRPAHARYSFDGTGEGELALSVGQELEVLDDRDHSWWYARDVRTRREGVVPAAYLY